MGSPFIPAFVRRAARKFVRDPRIARLPSRRWLHETLLPALAAAGHKRMLFVGVQSYNLPLYRHCAVHGIDVRTIDPDPAGTCYGAPGGHFVGSIQDVSALARGATFDVILFNGVLGFGVNTAGDAIAALDAMTRVAAPGALLVVGWNPGRTDDAEMAALRPHLTPTSLAGVTQVTTFAAQGIQTHPHLYELFRLRQS